MRPHAETAENMLSAKKHTLVLEDQNYIQLLHNSCVGDTS